MADWQQLQALFDQAVQLQGDERKAFIDRLAKDDSSLAEELQDLLDADGDDTLSPKPVGLDSDGAGPASDAGPDQLEGVELGAYRLIRRVGSGGMGAVYLAERADGAFERQAAVKVVRRGMNTDEVLQRFRAERQILSRLDHPNISALLDGGVTPDGRPYLVMEYVDGVPITQYCDQHCLSIAQRLDLFQAVCRAVHYAHQNLVVHRDLKPSNILVTEDGTVKLLDFGIAKLLDEAGDAGLTRTGLQAMTPAYASPEQLTSQPITTGTDVYALGVILYELLSGRRPYETRRTAEEMRELVLSGNAPRPSTAITKIPTDSAVDNDKEAGPTTLEAISNSRALSPGRLSQVLSGDLDLICLTAIRRESDERYSSALQLADELQRHQRGEPVQAQPPSVAYRVGKFVRRHRLGVATTAAVVMGFVIVVGYYTQQLAEERDSALANQQKAEELVGFITGLFAEADPNQSLGEEVTARQILEVGRERIESELAGQPELQASMQSMLGQVYYELGNSEAARSLLESALQQQSSQDSLDAADTRYSLAMIQQDFGDYEQAEVSIQYAIDQRRAALGPVSEPLREAIAGMAFLQETLADFERAEALHLEAFEMAETLHPEDDVARAQAHSQLAGFYRTQDRREEAEALLREGLEMMARLYDEGQHPLTAKMTRQLGGVMRNSNRLDEAEPLYLEAIAMQEALYGRDNHEVAVTYNGYSQLLTHMGRHEEALEANQTMISIMENVYDVPVPNMAAAYHNRATMLVDQDKLDEAVRHYDLALEVQDAVGLPPDHLNRSFPTNGKARILRDQGEYEQAEFLFRDMLTIRLNVLGEEHRLVAEQYLDLGMLLLMRQRFDESETFLLDAYDYFEATQGTTDPDTVNTARHLVDLYIALEQPGRAEQYQGVINAAEAEQPPAS